MIEIGTDRNGKSIGFTDEERARHIHIVGVTGTGKSKLLVHMHRQDIARGPRRGLCLIDPHGSVYDEIEQWCAMRGWGHRRRIHLIRPGDDELTPGFNPLRVVPGESWSVRVDYMVAAFGQAWGVESMNETPRLEKILRALFAALMARNLTLAEGPALLQAGDPKGLRRMLTEGLPDPMQQIIWDELNALQPVRVFAEHVESTITRLSRFLSAPSLRRIVGQRNHTIDFRAAMDNSEIVLVNLGAQTAFSRPNAAVLGSLLINDLFLTALGRPLELGKKRPFSLYIDEAPRFLTGDVESILDECRKFGLHAVLAHQRLGHLRDKGDSIYNAVMSINNKVVFGGFEDDDAEVMAKNVFRSSFSLERPKHILDKPIVVDEVPYWLESEATADSESSSTSETESRGRTETSGTSTGGAESYRVESDGRLEPSGTVESSGGSASTGMSEGYSTSRSDARARTETRGRSQTLKPVRVTVPTAVHSPEEELHLAIVKLRELPDRTAVVKRRGHQPVQVKTVEIKRVLLVPSIMARFREEIRAKSPYISRVADAEAEITARTVALLAPPSPPEEASERDEDERWVHWPAQSARDPSA